MIVAALFVDPRGPYFNLYGVDPWDITRDAKAYDGPWPIVAHPPCGPWGRLRHQSKYQDPTCAPLAVEALKRYGGILEHPAHSLLWDELDLPRPGEERDGLRCVEIRQVEWGHVARKETWLLSTTDCDELSPAPFPGRESTHWITGRAGEARLYGRKIASEKMRKLTPPLLAAELVRVARSARRTLRQGSLF
jgi:hypothetical protein